VGDRALLCAILGTWLTSGEAQTSTKPPIKFGLLVSKTQKGIAWGRKQEIAAQMAVAEIDKAGGVNGSKIDLIIYDTAGENQQAVILTRKLATEDKVVAILGPVFSAEAAVAFAQAKQLEVPIISGSAAMPGLAGKNKPWAFTAQATDYKVQLIVSKRFVEKYKVKRVALLQDTQGGIQVRRSHGRSMTAAGATVINADAPITFQTATPTSASGDEAEILNPDAVVFAGLYWRPRHRA
jgi:branched-chain amino acid transport system substrate-binding protein